MDYLDNFHAREENDFEVIKDNEQLLNDIHKLDKGYNIIWRKINRKDGSKKRSKIEFYSSGGIGTYIRDAESGEYYQYKVGSLEEDLFFKVSFNTGECKSRNGSSTLFFLSPNHFMKHMVINLNVSYINNYELKSQTRLKEIEKNREKKTKLFTEKIF